MRLLFSALLAILVMVALAPAAQAQVQIATLITPANGASNIDPTYPIQFTWTSVTDEQAYYLYVGTTLSGKDVVSSGETQQTSWSAYVQPLATFYVRMWTKVNGTWYYNDTTFSTSAGMARLTAPADGATNVDPSVPVQFAWTSVPTEQAYYLYVGTTKGAKDIVNTGETQQTSWSAKLNPSFKYYARMWTKLNGSWKYIDSTFTTGTGIARLITPANGATVPGQVQFTWNSVPDALEYVLWIGTTGPGSSDAGKIFTTSTSATAAVATNTAFYVRTWTQKSSGWSYVDSTFKTQDSSYMISPPNGATNIDPSLPVQYVWASVSNEQAYYLYVGTTRGAKDVVDSRETQATTWTAHLGPNTTYWARIWTKVNGQWSYSDSSLTTGTGIARLQSPANGATNVSQFQQFTWNTVPDSLTYSLVVSPTNYGTWDMYGDDLAPSVSSRYVWGLLPNTYYYARLCTEKLSGWTCSKSNFTTGPAGPLPDRQTFYNAVQSLTSQVRLMTQGMTNQATPGTPLYQELLDHNRKVTDGATCGMFTITLLDQMTPNQILGRSRDLSLDGVETHVIAEYWDPFNNKWQVADSTFGLVYFDPNSEIGQGAEDVNTLLLAGNLSAITPLFVTNNGSAYMTNYYLDPITMFNEVYPFGDLLISSLVLNYVPNSPVPFLNSSSLGAQGTTGIYVFQFVKQTDQITINNAGTLVNITPKNSYGWAPALRLWPGWYVTSQIPDGMNMYTFKRILF